jgi:hypothetical protein
MGSSRDRAPTLKYAAGSAVQCGRLLHYAFRLPTGHPPRLRDPQSRLRGVIRPTRPAFPSTPGRLLSQHPYSSTVWPRR